MPCYYDSIDNEIPQNLSFQKHALLTSTIAISTVSPRFGQNLSTSLSLTALQDANYFVFFRFNFFLKHKDCMYHLISVLKNSSLFFPVLYFWNFRSINISTTNLDWHVLFYWQCIALISKQAPAIHHFRLFWKRLSTNISSL